MHKEKERIKSWERSEKRSTCSSAEEVGAVETFLAFWTGADSSELSAHPGGGDRWKRRRRRRRVGTRGERLLVGSRSQDISLRDP